MLSFKLKFIALRTPQSDIKIWPESKILCAITGTLKAAQMSKKTFLVSLV